MFVSRERIESSCCKCKRSICIEWMYVCTCIRGSTERLFPPWLLLLLRKFIEGVQSSRYKLKLCKRTISAQAVWCINGVRGIRGGREEKGLDRDVINK